MICHLVLVQEMQAFDDVKSNRGAFVVPVQLSRCLGQRLPQISTLHPPTCLWKLQTPIILKLDKHAETSVRAEHL